MDSPRREQRCFPSSELQGSPIFKFLCTLSPIKQAKSAHVAQTYSELSFPAPLPVFVSPRAREKRELASGEKSSSSEEVPRSEEVDEDVKPSPGIPPVNHQPENACMKQPKPDPEPYPPVKLSVPAFVTVKQERDVSDDTSAEELATQEEINSEELQQEPVSQQNSALCRVAVAEEIQIRGDELVLRPVDPQLPVVAAQAGVLLKTNTCVRSLTFGMQALEEQVSFEIETLVTPERRRLSLQSDSMDGERSRTPRKKSRRSISSADGCKRCHCKKSKCLKLYCECFAAGVYCLDSCACRDCFNKPEFCETVLGTRQQIETRNPLAFAPKIVQSSESTPRVAYPEPGASARHKRGCHCKKSLCLKKYCECYQAGVGCSDGCRCNGCKNMYGAKKARDDPEQSEELQTDMELSVASISPITPTFPPAPPLLNSCELRRIYESTSMIQSRTPELNRESQLSPRWEGLEDICTVTPLAQHPLRPPPCSSTSLVHIKSEPPDHSPFSKPAPFPHLSPESCYLPAPPQDSTPPSPPSSSAKHLGVVMDHPHHHHHHQASFPDETPEFLQERGSPRTVIKGSPNKQKRVVPPNTCGMISASASVLRSRKLNLHTLPSLPPVTPFQFPPQHQQGYDPGRSS